ncbi:hypothetical protein IC762_30200 [Bradyrhizobium genosp. L]|uniref:hypothetical protein n=1 Tax=Bradyrhizobium genosp. L TaxID=83637 RepID=UPI0018A27EA0|nr:hypothetical protein [Bradyrhizobium genosp. L]QPF83892.1 hypothetical protein IC762_30200 [Bradyrhizobium genosp. L]
MNELKKVTLDEAIRLRWVLRDIRAARFTLSPVDPADLETLMRMGYVWIQGERPILTAAGIDEV